MFTKLTHILRLKKIKHWYEQYERILLPATMIGGVLLDAFTFRSINITSTFILLALYFVIAASTIFFVHAYDAKRIASGRITDYLRVASPLIIQFTFGALLSGVFVFYFFSGTLFVSWPLLGVLVFLMISNEIFRKYFARTTLQFGVFFFILFSLISIAIPFFVESLESKYFIISGILSVVFMFALLELFYMVKTESKKLRLRLAFTTLSIFLFLNILYFTHVIPPIPLSIREMTLSHGVNHVSGTYQLQVETPLWWKKLFEKQIFHKDADGTVYVYTAIFAPGNLQTNIIHEWKYYDEQKKQWITKSDLSFGISGGRKEGYRGYSFKNNVPEGKWRVYVKTQSGQVLGRMSFVVKNVDASVELKTVTK